MDGYDGECLLPAFMPHSSPVLRWPTASGGHKIAESDTSARTFRLDVRADVSLSPILSVLGIAGPHPKLTRQAYRPNYRLGTHSTPHAITRRELDAALGTGTLGSVNDGDDRSDAREMDYFNGEWRRVAVPLSEGVSALGLTNGNGATIVELDDFGRPISVSRSALTVIDRIEQHWPVIDDALADQLNVLTDEPLPLRYWLLTRLDAEGNPPDKIFAILPWDLLDRAVDAIVPGLEPGGEIGGLVEIRHWLTPAIHGLTGPLEQLDHGLRTGDDKTARLGASELLTKLRNAPVSRIPGNSRVRLARLVTRLDDLDPQYRHVSSIVTARLTGQLGFVA